MFARVFILGAFDRFNYGDILFAHISAHLLRRRFPNIEIHFVGFRRIDLRASGGVLVESFDFIEKFTNAPGRSLIWVSGGAVLDVRWWTMCQMLLTDRGSRLFRRLRRYLRDDLLDALCRRYARSVHPMPWIFAETAFQFREPVTVMYNSVGGSNFAGLPERLRSAVRDGLSRAKYLSVRDTKSEDALAGLGVASIDLVPDSAVLLNDMGLSRKIVSLGEGPEGRELAAAPQDDWGSYICFQCAGRFFKKFEPQICAQIKALHERTGLNVVVFGIGYAPLHDDDLAVRGLSDFFQGEDWLFRYLENDVSGIARVIANSQCYIGTSLHGYITAFAFSRPRVGLSPQVDKLIGFRDAWDLPAMPAGVEIPRLAVAAESALGQDPEAMAQTARHTREIYEENFSRIWELRPV